MTDPAIVLEVPDLADDCVRLRPWRVDDAPALVEAWSDPTIVAGSSPPGDRSADAAVRWIKGCEARRLAGQAFDLVIAGANDQVMGEVGLSKFDTGRRAALIGWWVHADRRGSGVATAAVSLFTKWALGPGRLRALIAEIGADNLASIRVAEHAGYVVLADARNPQESARGRGPRVWYVAHSTVK